MDKSVIIIVQSKTTGRMLLKKRNNEWKWPGLVTKDPDIACLHLAMEQTSYELGFDLSDSEDITMDFLDGFYQHQVFHMWIDGEPSTGVNNLWAAMFDFPEATHESVDIVLDNRFFLEKTISPD